MFTAWVMVFIGTLSYGIIIVSVCQQYTTVLSILIWLFAWTYFVCTIGRTSFLKTINWLVVAATFFTGLVNGY